MRGFDEPGDGAKRDRPGHIGDMFLNFVELVDSVETTSLRLPGRIELVQKTPQPAPADEAVPIDGELFCPGQQTIAVVCICAPSFTG